MKVGARIVPRPPFNTMRAAAKRARDLGLSSLWVPDHLMAFLTPQMFEGTGDRVPDDADLHAHVDPFVTLAAVAESSGEMLLGTSVTDPFRRMPATLVQAALTLDHLAPGRIILGLGAGEAANIVPYGWPMGTPGARFREAASEIRRFLDDPGPDDRGGIVGLRPPPGSDGPQLWMAAHGALGLEATGRLADGWLPTFMSPPEWQEARDRVRDSSRMADRAHDAVTLGLSLNVAMGKRHEDAHRALAHPSVRRLCLLMTPEQLRGAGMPTHPLGAAGLHTMIPTHEPERLAQAARDIPLDVAHRLIPHGTVDEIAALLLQYDGLEHVRLSDVGMRGDLHGELARIHAVAQRLEFG